MEPSRRWMPSSVCAVAALVLILPLIVALPLIAALPMTHAQERQAKADRLVLVPINPGHDDARTWMSSAETGPFSLWLAKSWVLAPDSESWRLQWQEDASYDNHALWRDDNEPVRKAPTTDYHNGIGAVERTEAVSDHEIGKRCQAARLAVQNHPAVLLLYGRDTPRTSSRARPVLAGMAAISGALG